MSWDHTDLSYSIPLNSTGQSDTEYEPGSDSDKDDYISCSAGEQQTSDAFSLPHQELKFILFSSALKTLLKWWYCLHCGCQDFSTNKTAVETMTVITLACSSCRKTSLWHGQPDYHNTPAGNILLLPALMLSCVTGFKVLRVLRHLGVTHMSTPHFL